jgi:hypothetical protein
MPSPSFEISSFRPRRTLFGYERRAVDVFLKHVAELLEEAGNRLDNAERELSQYREKEQSLNEALLAVAKTAESIKHDAHEEAEAVRAHVRELDQFVSTSRSQMSAFLHGTLESLERLSDGIHAGSQVACAQEPALVEPEPAEQIAQATPESEQDDSQSQPPEQDGSIFARLRPYLVDTSRAP